jgi:nucleoid DNA-binding protein
MAKKIKYHFINQLHEQILKTTSVTKNGQIKLKRSDLKKVVEDTFLAGAKAAAGGERVRFPVVGALIRKEVQARKAGKGINPFTKEEITLKARPASKKPRWSFNKGIKETFANKKLW